MELASFFIHLFEVFEGLFEVLQVLFADLQKQLLTRKIDWEIQLCPDPHSFGQRLVAPFENRNLVQIFPLHLPLFLFYGPFLGRRNVKWLVLFMRFVSDVFRVLDHSRRLLSWSLRRHLNCTGWEAVRHLNWHRLKNWGLLAYLSRKVDYLSLFWNYLH